MYIKKSYGKKERKKRLAALLLINKLKKQQVCTRKWEWRSLVFRKANKYGNKVAVWGGLGQLLLT